MPRSHHWRFFRHTEFTAKQDQLREVGRRIKPNGNKEAIRRDDGVGRKCETHRVAQFPTVQRQVLASLVIQFNEFIDVVLITVQRRRVIHDLADDHRPDPRRAVKPVQSGADEFDKVRTRARLDHANGLPSRRLAESDD